MAKTKKVVIETKEFTLQSVSPTFYVDTTDECNLSGGSGKRKTSKYMDTMFKNCVISPSEVKAMGLSYFDENDDLKTAMKLMNEIETFLNN